MFVAVLVFVPLIYLIVAVAVVQRARLATSNAARDVGRAIATSDSADQADSGRRQRCGSPSPTRACDRPTSSCASSRPARTASPRRQIAPSLAAGAEFRVCVIRHQRLPAVPTVLSGRGVTTIGAYLVHVDEFRTIR